MVDGSVKSPTIDALLTRMTGILDDLGQDPRHYFLAVYRRTTEAVAQRIGEGFFRDGAWLERWDLAFASRYLDALEASPPTAPWQAAFGAPADAMALQHVLLGMNAHINFDLPLALLEVISDAEFENPDLLAIRRIDHERIDAILASRVGAEDDEFAKAGRSFVDTLLAPLNRRASKRFLAEARRKVWANTVDLAEARRSGQASLDAWTARLSELSEQRVLDLVRPGLVLLRLARDGFGVLLRPELPMRSFDPVVLGTAERDAWATYYRHEWAALLSASWRLTREAFDLPVRESALIAWWVARANQKWAPFPDNDPAAARGYMFKVFSLVAREHHLTLDPRRAAELEVAWWHAHRQAQHDEHAGQQALVGALAESYAYQYGVEVSTVRRAAELRADAMQVSDAWVADGCDADSPALDMIADLLVRSYSHLFAAVREPLPVSPPATSAPSR